MDEGTLLSIKEFSDFTGVNQSTLRYYDEIGILPPASRGDNNYRYYAPFQIIKLNYINVLVDLGVPLSVIKDMDMNRTPQSVAELLGKQEIKLDRRLRDLHNAYSLIHTYRKNIQYALNAEHGDIKIEELDEMRLVLGHVNNFEKNNVTFYEEFIRFCVDAELLGQEHRSYAFPAAHVQHPHAGLQIQVIAQLLAEPQGVRPHPVLFNPGWVIFFGSRVCIHVVSPFVTRMASHAGSAAMGFLRQS